MTDRRRFLSQLTAILVGARYASRRDDLAAIEQRLGGHLGVAALDVHSGKRVSYRDADRFPMCSTFKFLAAASVLHRVDQGEEHLDRRISFGAGDLLEHAPVTRAHVQAGSMTLGDLCAAAVEESDNTAANLILGTFGGPPALTGYARALGDPVTRLDRTEPALNEAVAGDERDTTTPAAMLGDMRAILTGNALSPASRDRLTGWLVASTTGAARLRAGLPPGWQAGDKTGTGRNGASGDLAIVWPPNRQPLLIAAYALTPGAADAARDAAYADVARLVSALPAGSSRLPE
jgi:beta-lactamase class A